MEEPIWYPECRGCTGGCQSQAESGGLGKECPRKLGSRVADLVPVVDRTRWVILFFGKETNDDNVLLMFHIGWLIKPLI
jgi:hypothetical protein